MEEKNLSRTLQSRHITMIAIGGAIGTGLFVATGGVIAQAGPGGAILAYIIIGIMLYFLMSSIGEMATFYPVSGAFSSYATRFVDPSLGFTMGWLYWTIWSLVTSVDVIVASNVISYWDTFHFFSPLVWSLLFLTLLFLVNVFTVKAFGEAEFWLSLIKVITIIIFIILGILMIFGILGGHYYGLKNFTVGEAPFVGGISGFLSVLLIAGFSVGGTEVVAVTAGESDNPRESMPKAIKQVFWRILLFYVLSIAVISSILAYTDPTLLNENGSIAQSPFTIVFDKVGIAFAASVINAVILTSLLSAANSGVFTTSRMLYSLSQHGQAPQFLGKIHHRSKLPLNALFTTFVFIAIVTLYANYNPKSVIGLLNIIGALVTFVWGSSLIAQIRMRRAIKKQNKNIDQLLAYKAPFFPVGPIIVIAILLFLIFGSSAEAIVHFEVSKLLQSFLPIIVLIVVYFVHKAINKTKVIPLEEIDLSEHESYRES
ncbi:MULTISPECIES: amino acid permease [Staphylococcus]|uniref:amino acid permease n=1 Tax=Staphylococcus TaxID=1279 RepID=UPI0013F41DF4|nr:MULTISPECIES: amino acid permease [Staphylococcus]NHA36150.1 gamma-aminobutyrate permease [Staphylococcus schleiferi]MBA8763454.1 amino acid permease [Staphylococcus coagulans]MBT2809029.1 amino acid permease [Staphylococcus coagulans]MBT2811276.1 amino acid permease [Staphylococcus coagulans]MBT2813803.1 amino acid permease [Staphylococcus coagulans]